MYDDSVRAGLTTVSQFVPRFFLSAMVSSLYHHYGALLSSLYRRGIISISSQYHRCV